MGILRVLEGSCEETCSWRPDVPDEVARARAAFEEYGRRGFLACRISGGNRGAPLAEFDPEAEEIFLLELSHGG